MKICIGQQLRIRFGQEVGTKPTEDQSCMMYTRPSKNIPGPAKPVNACCLMSHRAQYYYWFTRTARARER